MHAEVEKAIKDAKEGKASGLDRITMKMIKEGADTVVKFLTDVFNRCLEESKIITQRLHRYLDYHISLEQAGFRPDF